MRQFLVVGAGTFGSSVALTLSQLGHEVLVLDKDEDKVRQISAKVSRALELDATDETALRSLGIEGTDVAVVSIGQEMEASILVTMTLKEMGVQQVVSKALTEAHGRVLRRVGADRVVFPERQMGIRIANALSSPSIVDLMELAPGYSLAEIQAPRSLCGKSIAESRIRSEHGVTVVAIRKRRPSLDPSGESALDEDLIMAPGPEVVIQESDRLVVLGKAKQVDSLQSSNT